MTRALLERAAQLREQYALGEARHCCEEVLRRSPQDAAALDLMAALAADERDAEAAMRWAQRAIAADPGAAAPHYTLGRVHQAEGRLAEAETCYRNSLALDANQARAHNNLGSVLQMQGRLAEAMASFRRALAIDPSLPQANQNLAAITRDRGALEAAAAGYRRAAAANPADAQLWNDLGNVYRELGRHGDALASFAEAIARQPALAEAHFSMAQVQLHPTANVRGIATVALDQAHECLVRFVLPRHTRCVLHFHRTVIVTTVVDHHSACVIN